MPLPVLLEPPLDPLLSRESNLLATLLVLVGLFAANLMLLPLGAIAFNLNQTPAGALIAGLFIFMSLTGVLQSSVKGYCAFLKLKRSRFGTFKTSQENPKQSNKG